MESKVFGPRKRRMRQHVIADLGVHYVEGFVLEEGHTTQRVQNDYGYDLLVSTFDEQGFVEPGFVRIQVKASDKLIDGDKDVGFDVDIRDVNLWLAERSPVLLVLYDASKKRAFWLDVQRHFNDNLSWRSSTKTIRVRISKRRDWNCDAVRSARRLKQETLPPIRRIKL